MGALVERSGFGALPASSDASQWDDREKALALQLGLAVTKRNGGLEIADRGTVEAFLAHCERTKLDPIARQIYIIKRGQKWQTQISIDGARLVAERSGDYEGQTPVEWSGDGREWVQAWAADVPPRFARAGVYKRGFREALFTVARWESYAVYQDEWVYDEGQRKRVPSGDTVLSPMWAKMPDLMLGKVAEMLALRKAFPMDLSGLYSTEEMQQADAGRSPAPRSPQAEAPPVGDEFAARAERRASAEHAVADRAAAPDVVDAEVVEESEAPDLPAFDREHWAMRITQCTTVEQLGAVWGEAESSNLLYEWMDAAHSTRLGDLIMRFKKKLEGAA